MPRRLSRRYPAAFALAAIALAAIALAAAPTAAHAERPLGTYEWRTPSAASHGDGHVPRLLYLNRCRGGCVITPGGESAQGNQSTIAQTTATLAEFPHGDASWDAVLECVRQQYFRFNINVTDVDPGDQDHFESIVAGSAADLAKDGAAGVAPFMCEPWPNSINFTFAETVGNNPQALCEVITQESGHALGLEHALLCEDPMTYLSGCGPKSFQDTDAECGESSPRPCSCGSDKQNSVKHLLEVFGPGQRPATADIEVGTVGEDPEKSNGDGIVEPGERVRISLAVTNKGNKTAENIDWMLASRGRLRLLESAAVAIPGGTTEVVELAAEVEDSACGETVTFDVSSALGGEAWSASSSVIAGISDSEWREDFATAADWRAEAAEETQGGWEFGTPKAAFFAGRQLQPGEGGGGPGDEAWVTGLEGRWDQGIVVGETTLTSAAIDVGSWHAVTGLDYSLWYVALDRTPSSLDNSPEAHLIVELSSDGGETWTEVDRVMGERSQWERRSVAVPSLAATAEVKLRFIAKNDKTAAERLVEVGIDGVALRGGELVCTPGGCSMGGAGTAGSAALLLAAFCLRRRRRHGPEGRSAARSL